VSGVVVLQLAGGLALLTLGASALVRGTASLARRVGVSPLVIGVTLVAFLTSAPEISVSVLGAATGQDDIAAGNVVGSNVFNVLVVIGLCALLRPLTVAQQLVFREIPIKIGVSVLLWLFAANGSLSVVEGAVFLAGLALFTYDTVRSSRREAAAIRSEYEESVPALSSSALVDAAQVAGGLAMLVLGGNWLVAAAVEVASAAGVDETTIGLTIVAAGTSLPEVATSLAATLRGERDIAVGNVVGSSVFNILGIAGLAAVVSPGGLDFPPGLVAFDLPFMVAVAVACLPIVAGDHRISRPVGMLFLGAYAAYISYLVLAAKSHAALEPFSAVMLEFAAPLSAVAVVAYLYRRRSTRREADGSAGGGAGRAAG
jgi:cation:H+ antiporter